MAAIEADGVDHVPKTLNLSSSNKEDDQREGREKNKIKYQK